MLACFLTNGAASQRCETDRRHRSNVEKGMPIHCGFSFDLSPSAREPVQYGLRLTADERDRLVERGAARTDVTHRGVLVPDRHAAEEDEPVRR